MADLSFSTRVLVDLYPALLSLGVAEPPMNAQGRYIVRKATEKAEKDYKGLAAEETRLIEQFGKRDAEGKLLPPTVHPNGRVTRQLTDGAAYQAELDKVMAVEVTLTGLRAITREELGACPITVNAEKALIAAGLLAEIEFTP